MTGSRVRVPLLLLRNTNNEKGGCHQIGDARPFSFSRMSCFLSYGTIGGLQNPGVLLAVALTSPENIIALKIIRKLPVGCPRHCG